MISNAKNQTAQRKKDLEANVEEKAKRDLLDFSNAETNFQEFEGVDYKALQGQGDMVFMEMMQVRRDRGLLMISARLTYAGGHSSAGLYGQARAHGDIVQRT